MANVKYVINASDDQIANLKKALHVGSPLDVALKYSRISKATFYYWVAIANVVKAAREQEFIRLQEEEVNSGVSMSDVQMCVDNENKANSGAKYTIDAFIQPTKESLMKYRNNKRFKEYADKVYDIINECDSLRSEIVLYHLTAIRDAARQRGGNAVSSQWFLERTMPEFFGRQDTINQNIETKGTAPAPVVVKFVNPKDAESKDRVKMMEQTIMDELGHKGLA